MENEPLIENLKKASSLLEEALSGKTCGMYEELCTEEALKIINEAIVSISPSKYSRDTW